MVSRWSGDRGPVGRSHQLGPDRKPKTRDPWALWGEPVCSVGLEDPDGAVQGQPFPPMCDDVRAGLSPRVLPSVQFDNLLSPPPCARRGPHGLGVQNDRNMGLILKEQER